MTAADLAARTRAAGQDVFGSHALADIQQHLKTHLAPGDVLVVMGAGDIGKVAHGLVDWFRETSCGRLNPWPCTPGFNWAARRNSLPNRKIPTS